MLTAAILFLHGFTQPAGGGPGVGLYQHETELGRIFPDRDVVRMRSSTWDGDVIALANDFADVNPAVIAVDAYSWGNVGCCKFANALASRGREIDLLVSIDPVPHVMPYWLNACVNHGGYFSFPSNVKQILAIRTINSGGIFSPFGRDVVDPLASIQRVVIGPPGARFAPSIQFIADKSVVHASIDDYGPVEDLAVGAIHRLIAGVEGTN